MAADEYATKISQFGIGYTKNTINMTVKARSSNEMLSLMRVIDFLSKEADQSREPLDIKVERDFNKKINLRFASYRSEIMTELGDLTPLYQEKYKTAWGQSGVSEARRDEINVLLSRRSKAALAAADDNPIVALDTLTDWLVDEASKAADDNQEYSHGAIRYFLHTEFQRCNVFPNGGLGE